jgi:hypothetical protein
MSKRHDYTIRRKAKGQWVLSVGGTKLNTYPSRAAAFCVAKLLLGRGPGSIHVETNKE